MKSFAHCLTPRPRVNTVVEERCRGELPREWGWLRSTCTVTPGSTYIKGIFSDGIAQCSRTVRRACWDWAIESQTEGDDSPCLSQNHLFHKNRLVTWEDMLIAHCFIHRKSGISPDLPLLAQQLYWASAILRANSLASFNRAQRKVGTAHRVIGQEASRATWSHRIAWLVCTCIPSWPEIPTPTSATWIMLTSLAPSPRNSKGRKNCLILETAHHQINVLDFLGGPHWTQSCERVLGKMGEKGVEHPPWENRVKHSE